MKKVLLLLTVLIVVFLSVSCSDQPKTPGKVYFCTVALNYSSNSAEDLSATEEDQKSLIKQINCIMGKDDVIKSFGSFNNDDTPVSSSVIKEYIDSLRDSVEENDVFIFHYSGHGYYDGSLVLDSKEGRYKYEKLSPSVLIGWLDSLNCNKVLLLDSCFSGNLLPKDSFSNGYKYSQTTHTDSSGYNYRKDELKKYDFFEAVKNAVKDFGETSDKSKKTWGISVCSSYQEAPGYAVNNKYGLLSGLALSYLGYDLDKDMPAKKNGQKYTVYGMFDYILSKVSSKAGISTCTPQTNFKPVDLVLFRT